ncbi:MAG: 1-deoxy-D-xylulose-5-phosphate reductoisomerase [Planctomycetes bacterium]|nr:1-deoxy-D-xylulose-5-phosphate reductoisomerase [Planctomycetota bacterium]
MASSPRRIIILGATGTVGVRALQILEDSPLEWRICATSAHSQQQLLADTTAHADRRFLTSNPTEHQQLLDLLREGDYDICLNAVVGAAGLPFSEAVLSAGCDLALANKESLVMAGSILMPLARKNSATIIPVDSEHSAIFQCLANSQDDIKQLFLTASGGALRDVPLTDLASATPEQALAHPNWDMGPRITVDSATMMNKAFEIVEAHWLFDVAASDINVLIHRQSIIHSMVEFVDGSILSQMGPPDMGFPLHFALHYPTRQPANLSGFDAKLFSELSLHQPQLERYPALAMAAEVIERGGDAGAVLNAADEVAVNAFLANKISYGQISEMCAAAIEHCCHGECHSIEQIIAADQRSRTFCEQLPVMS